jgi:hypothetical protein
MATRVHRPLKVLAFNANGIGRQRYELSKQLHIDVALLSEAHLIQAIIFTGPTASRVEKSELPLQLEKASP